jgi:hypothetical protein
MRREFIYPHRSVRAFPASRKRLYAVIGIAAAACLVIVCSGSSLLDAHARLAGFLMNLSGIPSTGFHTVAVFPFLRPVTTAIIPIPQHQENPYRLVWLFVVSFSALILIHRLVPLGRSFVVFLTILLCAAGIVIIFKPSFQLSSAMYEQIWLRGEFLVWMLLPWISALLFMLSIPSFRQGLAWGLFLQIYAIVWSAVRLAFCLGVFHYSGILFFPLLWFCLGILFDLVYMMVFYSFALQFSIKQVLGERES